MKIYIVGCAKTGTTLVRRLMNAFDLKVYNYDEMGLTPFVYSDFDVAKRTWNAPFSNIMSDTEMNKQMDIVRSHSVKIINCVRNRDSVLKSDNGWVKPERYDACMDQAERFRSYVSFTVIYEELLHDPDKVQHLLAHFIGLKIKHHWSDYPKFVDITQEKGHTHNGNYSLRPIGAKY